MTTLHAAFPNCKLKLKPWEIVIGEWSYNGCMRACVHAHGPWLSLDLDAPSSLELPRTRKPCSTCDTLAHQTASCSVTVHFAAPAAATPFSNLLCRAQIPCIKVPNLDFHQRPDQVAPKTRTFRSSRSERCCTLSIAPNCCWRCSLSGRALWCPCPAGTAPGGPRATSSPASPSPVRASCRTSTSPGEASTSCCRA
jgi:hypothetical protein